MNPFGRTGLLAVVASCLAVGLVACGDADELDPSSVDSVTYTFIGPSTPPEFHDEYVLVVTSDEATLRVGTYGTVDGSEEPRDQETLAIDADTWEALVAGLDELPDSADAAGCSGGSTRMIAITAGDGDGRSVSIYECGSENEEASAALEDAVEPVLGLFELETLLD